MIKHRRRKWLVHELRLNEETPARIGLNECIINKKLPVGRPKFTWLEGIKQDLKNVMNFKDTTQGFKDLKSKDIQQMCFQFSYLLRGRGQVQLW